MTPELHQRARAVFFAVCDAPEAERGRLLEEHCAGDAGLRTAVDALLRDDPGESGSGVLAPRAEAAVIRSLLDEEPAFEPVGELAGCRIIRKIGEGGMGAVYECEQPTPRRRVAIKLVRQGLASPAVHRRFRNEGEVLGRLRHPNIARVYGSGTTGVVYADGRSERCAYLMMERVEGPPLNAFARGLDVRGRVELMIAVCDGVRHAHAMGVVHRDLKPANILVESLPELRPRILDFGVARATGGPEATFVTAPGQVLGTLAYMAPEQVAGDPAAVDTRSDVYALGVILYEVLAGRLPLDIGNASILDAARIVADVEPPELTGLPGDLCTIVAKALRKAPEERYQSAGEFAADLGRFLRREPISARPATRLYILRRFTQRNPGLVAATAAAVLALLAGAAAATTGLWTARRANADLLASNEAMTRQLRRSEQVVGLMRKMLTSVRPKDARDRDTTLMREVLGRALKQIDAGELKDQPLVEAEMRGTIAETYAALGDNKAALAQVELAMAPVRAAPADADPVFQRIRRAYADILFDWTRFDEAGRELDALIDLRRRAGEPESDADAELMAARAAVLDRLGKSQESLVLRLAALELRRRVVGDKHPSLVADTANLAGTLQNLGRYEEALPLLRDGLAICEGMDPPALMHITILRNNLADLLNKMNRHEEAEACLRRGLEVAGAIYAPDHQQVGLMRYNLGATLRALGRREQALAEFRAGARILDVAFGAGHPLAAGARIETGVELAALGRPEEARAELLAARAALAAAGAPPDAGMVEVLKQCEQALAALPPAPHP